MPILVPDPNPAAGGLPTRLLRPLWLSRATETVDPDDGSVTTSWTTIGIWGRIARGATGEAVDDGRQGAVTTVKLLTNSDQIRPQDRVLDGRDGIGIPTDTDPEAWQVAGEPIAVWGLSGVHHYEAPLRRADS